MKNLIQKIDNSKHIVLLLPNGCSVKTFGCASAFYTYILTLHKKVSLYIEKNNFDNNLSVIPWFDKVRTSFVSSSDLTISFEDKQELDISPLKLYDFFIENSIKINQKMATALYASVLDYSDNFVGQNVNGILFAMVARLIELKADHIRCNKMLVDYQKYSSIRIKGRILNDFELIKDAKVAVFRFDDTMLKAYGATIKDVQICAKEILHLPTVKILMLVFEELDFKVKVYIYRYAKEMLEFELASFQEAKKKFLIF